jgi:hypothetical protein|tara:strand:+ start:177 stop:374 length:198 start_codon:yes stop_codon:yes gene_type:complete
MGNLNLPVEVVNREGDFASDDLYRFAIAFNHQLANLTDILVRVWCPDKLRLLMKEYPELTFNGGE